MHLNRVLHRLELPRPTGIGVKLYGDGAAGINLAVFRRSKPCVARTRQFLFAQSQNIDAGCLTNRQIQRYQGIAKTKHAQSDHDKLAQHEQVGVAQAHDVWLIVKKSDFGDNTQKKNHRHRGQYQAKTEIAFFLF